MSICGFGSSKLYLYMTVDSVHSYIHTKWGFLSFPADLLTLLRRKQSQPLAQKHAWHVKGICFLRIKDVGQRLPTQTSHRTPAGSRWEAQHYLLGPALTCFFTNHPLTLTFQHPFPLCLLFSAVGPTPHL